MNLGRLILVLVAIVGVAWMARHGDAPQSPQAYGTTAATASPITTPTARLAADETYAGTAAEGYLYHGSPPCLVVADRSLQTQAGEYAAYIAGKLQNHCSRAMRYVSIRFTFYDRAGNLESSGLVNVNDLAAGQAWAFRKPIYEQHTVGGQWKITKIVGF